VVGNAFNEGLAGRSAVHVAPLMPNKSYMGMAKFLGIHLAIT